jgi:hypothetical protein
MTSTTTNPTMSTPILPYPIELVPPMLGSLVNPSHTIMQQAFSFSPFASRAGYTHSSIEDDLFLSSYHTYCANLSICQPTSNGGSKSIVHNAFTTGRAWEVLLGA